MVAELREVDIPHGKPYKGWVPGAIRQRVEDLVNENMELKLLVETYQIKEEIERIKKYLSEKGIS